MNGFTKTNVEIIDGCQKNIIFDKMKTMCFTTKQ